MVQAQARRRFHSRLPASPSVILSVLAALVALTLFVWPAVVHAIDVWSTDEEFGYGFLILPISAALILWRRATIRASVGRGSFVGLLIMLGAIIVSLIGRRVGIHALSGLAVCPLLWGIAVYLWGWRAGRELAFPIAFLAFGLGLYRGLLDSVGFTLQEVTAFGAAGLGHLLGLPVIREGLVLRSAQFAFIVAEKCSGMNSLLSLLALSALWANTVHGSITRRLAVMLSVLPLVVVANTARVALVLLVASWLGQDAALGFFHGLSSLVLFGIALGGLLLFGRIIGCSVPSFATSS